MQFVLKSIALIFFSLSFVTSSNAKSEPGYKSASLYTKADIDDHEKSYRDNCITQKKYSSFGCAQLEALFIVYSYSKNNYSKALEYSSSFYKNALAASSQNNCPYAEYGNKAAKDTTFVVGYYEAIYALYAKLDQTKAKKYAVRAFMCAVDETRYFRESIDTISKDGMGRQEFISAMKRFYGNNPAYDAQRVMDEVIIPLSERTTKLRIGKRWGKDAEIDAKDSVNLSALVANAMAYLKKEGFGKEFLDYYADLKAIYDNMVKFGEARREVRRK